MTRNDMTAIADDTHGDPRLSNRRTDRKNSSDHGTTDSLGREYRRSLQRRWQRETYRVRSNGNKKHRLSSSCTRRADPILIYRYLSWYADHRRGHYGYVEIQMSILCRKLKKEEPVQFLPSPNEHNTQWNLRIGHSARWKRLEHGLIWGWNVGYGVCW